MANARFGVSKKHRNFLFETLDNSSYLGLDGTQRMDQVMYAIALGIESGNLSVPKGKIELVRSESIPADYQSQLLALLIAKCVDENDFSVELSLDEAIKYSEMLADAGLDELESRVATIDATQLESEVWVRLDELNEQFSNLADEYSIDRRDSSV